MRSKSKTRPAPCVLIVRAAAGYGERFAVEVDEGGVVDYDSRHHHQSVRVWGLRPDRFDSSKISRRRPDLERFDEDDLALIRYGCVLDFDGRIHHRYPGIPLTKPAEWTVFWFPPYGSDEFRYPDFKQYDRERKLFGGAWHFHNHGGPKHLGFKYGHVWATRHTGSRLDKIRAFLKRQFPDLMELHSSVVRWTEGGITYTTEMREECPALFGHGTIVEGGAYSYTTAHITPQLGNTQQRKRDER